MKIACFHTMLFCIASTIGCERSTQVKLEGGTSPVFHLSGSGNVTDFSVYIVSPSDFSLGRTVDSPSSESFFTQHAVWRIETRGGGIFHAPAIQDIGQLTYGIVPKGYTQSIPSDGSAPPPILQGRQYFFDCATVNAPGTRGFFQLIDGKVVPLQINLPCLTARNGKEVAVPCLAN
jgi:hypothetical protein